MLEHYLEGVVDVRAGSGKRVVLFSFQFVLGQRFHLHSVFFPLSRQENKG